MRYSFGPLIGEDFLLGEDEIAFMHRVMDFWQLMSPMSFNECDHPRRISRNGGPFQGVWSYDSLDPDLEWFGGMR